jgi:hypothetical protein
VSKPKLLGEVVDGKLYGPGAAPPPAATIGGKGAAARAAEGLAELVPDALQALKDSLRMVKAPRGVRVGSRSSDARYVLDVVLERLPEAEAKPAGAVAQLTPDAAVRELRRRLSGGDE